MKDLMEQYGGLIAGSVGAAGILGIIVLVMKGPFARYLLMWAERFL